MVRAVLYNPGSKARTIYKKNLYEAFKTIVRIGPPLINQDTVRPDTLRIDAFDPSGLLIKRIYAPTYLSNICIYKISDNNMRSEYAYYEGPMPFYLVLKNILKYNFKNTRYLEIVSNGTAFPIIFYAEFLFKEY